MWSWPARPSTALWSSPARCSPSTTPSESAPLRRAIARPLSMCPASPRASWAAASARWLPPSTTAPCTPIWRSWNGRNTSSSWTTSPAVWTPPFTTAIRTSSSATTPTTPSASTHISMTETAASSSGARIWTADMWRSSPSAWRSSPSAPSPSPAPARSSPAIPAMSMRSPGMSMTGTAT